MAAGESAHLLCAHTEFSECFMGILLLVPGKQELLSILLFLHKAKMNTQRIPIAFLRPPCC